MERLRIFGLMDTMNKKNNNPKDEGKLPILENITQDETKKANGQSLNKKTSGYVCIAPGNNTPLPDSITVLLKEIQNSLNGMPLWLLVHDGDEENEIGWMSEEVWQKIYSVKNEFTQDIPIALILDSPGGDAPSAYRMAKFLRNRCGEFVVYVPKYAKSAATLLSFGAKEILIGKEGDLGPLDVQIRDFNEEKIYSALDEVQAIDSLFDFATKKVIQTTVIWKNLMKKKSQTVLPLVIDYVTKMMKPLMDKIDTVHYMSLSRSLSIAEEYAVRLLTEEYGDDKAKIIARNFVKNYPTHEFIIDLAESKKVGLDKVKFIPDDLQEKFDALLREVGTNYLIGRFYEKAP